MGPWRIYQVDGAYSRFAPTLQRSQLGALDRYIVRLAERGPLIGEDAKMSLPIKGHENLYELRPKDVRMFYCFVEDRSVVLLLGVVKDQKRLRKEVFKRAAKLRDEVCAMGAIQWERLTEWN
jgi:hypothetical protein